MHDMCNANAAWVVLQSQENIWDFSAWRMVTMSLMHCNHKALLLLMRLLSES